MRIYILVICTSLAACSPSNLGIQDAIFKKVAPNNVSNEIIKVKLSNYKFDLPKREDIQLYHGTPHVGGNISGWNFGGPSKWRAIYRPEFSITPRKSVKVIRIQPTPPFFQKSLPNMQESDDPYCARSRHIDGPVCKFQHPDKPIYVQEHHYGKFRVDHNSQRHNLGNGWTRTRNFIADKDEYYLHRIWIYSTSLSTSLQEGKIDSGAAIIKCKKIGRSNPFLCKVNSRLESGLYTSFTYETVDSESILPKYDYEVDIINKYWDDIVEKYSR